MSLPGADAFMGLMQTEKQRFVADYVEKALMMAVDDGINLRFTENGMSESTCYARRLEDDAALAAAAAFSRVLRDYLVEAENYTQDGPYNDVVEHVGNEYRGAGSEDEQDAFERIGEAHFKFLRTRGQANAKGEHAQEAALFLLKSPLEFADLNSAALLNAEEQKRFTAILMKLRGIAKNC